MAIRRGASFLGSVKSNGLPRRRHAFTSGLWLSLLLVWLAADARGDGKVLPPVALAQEIAMPDQRALLAWKDGVETLVIESSFVGEGTDFAWVVPLPAKPEVEPATRGTLSSAAALMLPTVIPSQPGLSGVLVVGLAVVLTAAFAGWRTVGFGLRVVVVASAGAVIGGIAGAFLGLAGVSAMIGAAWACVLGKDLIRRETSLLAHLLVLVAGLLLWALTIPTFGKVRGLADDPSSVAGGLIVERRVVGDFDVTLLSGRGGDGVARWLVENGFALPDAARAEAERHAAAGGWFVASRVRRDFAARGRSTPAPLVFRFPTAKPVYPMRFTGAGATGPLEVELFVFGPGRATARGLDPKAWGPVTFSEPDPRGVYRRGTGQPHASRVVTHPQLRRLAEGAAVVTHLRGKLSPAEMRDDLEIAWDSGNASAQGLVAYAREATWQAGASAGLGVTLIAMIVLGFWHDGRRPPARRSAPWVAAGAALACLVAWRLPTVALRDGRGGVPWYALRQIQQAGMITILNHASGRADEARIREKFAEELERFVKGSNWTIQVGDGPGEADIVLLPTGKWRVVLYDAAGQARYNSEDDIEADAAPAGARRLP